MDDLFLINDLLDFYGVLLTEKQRKICSDYYEYDNSLQEIAESMGISRSAVHDTLKRSRKELEEYEEKMHLLASYQKRMKLYEQIKKQASEEISKLIDDCINTEME